MFTLEALRDIWTHMEWADAEIWAVALNTEGAVGDASMRDKLVHVHQTQRAYLNMWLGRPQETVGSNDFDTLVTLREWARPCYMETQQFFDAADASTLTAPVPPLYRERMEPHLGRAHGRVTLGDTVLDVVSHTAHHRGQLNTLLRGLNAKPPLVEYIAWVWCGRQAADGIVHGSRTFEVTEHCNRPGTIQCGGNSRRLRGGWAGHSVGLRCRLTTPRLGGGVTA